MQTENTNFFRMIDENSCLTSISVSFEVKPELENVVLELAAEASFVTEFPLSIHNLESDVFVRRPSVKLENCKVSVVRTGRKEILWR
jgi:hypothetical protein